MWNRMATRVLICLYISLYITSALGDDQTKMSILRERMQLLEKRLSEDISIIRKELYSEVNNIKGSFDEWKSPALQSVTESTPGNTEQLQHDINEINKQLGVINEAFSTEKLSKRDLQQQLQMDQIRTTSTIMKGLNDLKETVKTNFEELELEAVTTLLKEINRALESIRDDCKSDQSDSKAKDCSDLFRKGYHSSGIYEIQPDTLWRPLKVLCDMDTNGGGWTVFQRRCDGSENFYRPWNDYKFGFGNLSAEFWLGNEFMYRITEQTPQELRIELEDFENDRRYAHYGIFEIMPAEDLYKIHLEDFNGNVTDNLIPSHNNYQFSTFDKGPSVKCSKSYKGGFWYSNCHAVNINGEYLKGEHKSYANGVNWKDFRGHHYSLKFTEMKFRPK